MRNSLAILISGRGSNLRAILESPVGEAVSVVVSDNRQAGGLEHAEQHKKPTHVVERGDYPTAAAFETALSRQLEIYRPQLIALAGFMPILSADFIARHEGNIVNIHPSLLPELRGLNTHQRALDAGMQTHGCSVHWVIAELDSGNVIAQQAVAVQADDDAARLAARVLNEEHRLYPRVLAELLASPHQ